MALTEEDRAGIDKLDPISKRNQLVKLMRAQAEDMARNMNDLEQMGVSCRVVDMVGTTRSMGSPAMNVHNLRFEALLRLS